MTGANKSSSGQANRTAWVDESRDSVCQMPDDMESIRVLGSNTVVTTQQVFCSGIYHLQQLQGRNSDFDEGVAQLVGHLDTHLRISTKRL